MFPDIFNIIAGYNVLVLVYFLALNMSSAVLLIFAAKWLVYFKLRSRVRICAARECAFVPPVAVLVPAHNEELTIADSISSLRKLDYPHYELVIVNDGSSDGTMDVLKKKFRLFPVTRVPGDQLEYKPVAGVYASALDDRIIVVDKANGGKADALNAGLAFARSRLFCAIDADSIIEKDALDKMVRPYLERDAKTIAVGGIVRIANGCRIVRGAVDSVGLPRSLLAAFQVMEYIRAFLCGRTGWSALDSLLIISGAFGLFERKAVIEAGGYRTGIVGEDMELVLRLHRIMSEQKKGHKMVFIPDPVCWTQAPESFAVLRAQRKRWQRGLAESLYYSRRMLCNPFYGIVGLLGMPFFFVFELLGPVIEVSGYFMFALCLALGWMNGTFAILFLLMAVVFGMFISLFSLLLEEFTVKRYDRFGDVLRLFVLAVLENFGYRQITSWWRFTALFDFLLKKNTWGTMTRKPFTQQEARP